MGPDRKPAGVGIYVPIGWTNRLVGFIHRFQVLTATLKSKDQTPRFRAIPDIAIAL